MILNHIIESYSPIIIMNCVIFTFIEEGKQEALHVNEAHYVQYDHFLAFQHSPRGCPEH